MPEDGADCSIEPHQLPAWGRDAIGRQVGGDLTERAATDGLVEDALHNRRRHRVGYLGGLALVPLVAVEYPRAGEGLAGAHAGHEAPHRTLADLLVLQLGRVAAHEADKLALG